jgi:hypothetical protein
MKAGTFALLVAVVVAGVLFLGLGGVGLRSTLSQGADFAYPAERHEDPPASGSYGRVYGVYQAKSGLGLFGVHIIAPEYRAQVGFVPPPGCALPHDAATVVAAECPGAPAYGPVSGGGSTAQGHRLVIVSVTVSKACHDLLATGDRWPASYAACAPG